MWIPLTWDNTQVVHPDGHLTGKMPLDLTGPVTVTAKLVVVADGGAELTLQPHAQFGVIVGNADQVAAYVTRNKSCAGCAPIGSVVDVWAGLKPDVVQYPPNEYWSLNTWDAPAGWGAAQVSVRPAA
jgi:hypothetical protein